MLLCQVAPSHSLADASGHTSLHPLSGCDAHGAAIGGLVIAQALKYTADHWSQLEAVLRPHEIEDSKTVELSLVRWGCNDAMNAALEETVGEELERIREIDGDASRVWLDPLPLRFRRANLECGNGLSK